MFNYQSRKIHRICAWVSSIPILIIVITGIFLQIKDWIPWIQPKSVHNKPISVSLASLEQMFDLTKNTHAVNVSQWEDIRSIDVRPSQGVARVRTKSEFEVTIDLEKNQVVQVAPRRTGVLIQLHEGKFFGEIIKYGIFLPAGICMLVIWVSGLFLLLNVRYQKMKKLNG